MDVFKHLSTEESSYIRGHLGLFFFENCYTKKGARLRGNLLFYKDEERFCGIGESVRVGGGGCDTL